jgi:hypothetical protein
MFLFLKKKINFHNLKLSQGDFHGNFNCDFVTGNRHTPFLALNGVLAPDFNLRGGEVSVDALDDILLGICGHGDRENGVNTGSRNVQFALRLFVDVDHVIHLMDDMTAD